MILLLAVEHVTVSIKDHDVVLRCNVAPCIFRCPAWCVHLFT